jgi:hypothetical protein
MENFSFYNLSVFLGIIGMLLILFSFIIVLPFVKTKSKYKLHKSLAITGLLASLIHGFVMLFFSLFS